MLKTEHHYDIENITTNKPFAAYAEMESNSLDRVHNICSLFCVPFVDIDGEIVIMAKEMVSTHSQ